MGNMRVMIDSLTTAPFTPSFQPVPRKPRNDGWSPARQTAFLLALSRTAMVNVAARAVGMSVVSCYRLRRAPGAQSFAAAWNAARAHGFESAASVDAVLRAAANEAAFERHISTRVLIALLRKPCEDGGIA
jgi:hypothetical protein